MSKYAWLDYKEQVAGHGECWGKMLISSSSGYKLSSREAFEKQVKAMKEYREGDYYQQEVFASTVEYLSDRNYSEIVDRLEGVSDEGA